MRYQSQNVTLAKPTCGFIGCESENVTHVAYGSEGLDGKRAYYGCATHAAKHNENPAYRTYPEWAAYPIGENPYAPGDVTLANAAQDGAPSDACVTLATDERDEKRTNQLAYDMVLLAALFRTHGARVALYTLERKAEANGIFVRAMLRQRAARDLANLRASAQAVR